MKVDFETNSASKQEVLASRSRGRMLIARTWFGRTRKEFADEYLRYSYENGVLEVEKKPGCLGMQQFLGGTVAESTDGSRVLAHGGDTQGKGEQGLSGATTAQRRGNAP